MRSPRPDGRRACRAVVLASWTSFFAWLWFGGEVSRYLGPRTQWVIVFGFLVLLGATVANAMGALRGTGPPARIPLGEAAGMALLLAPILVLVLVPRPGLGALAAARKTTSPDAIALGALAAPVPEPGSEVSFIDLDYANRSADYAREARIVEGTPVRLLGFVTHSERSPKGGFELTRFYVSCCAADAIPYSALVVPGSEIPGGARSSQRNPVDDVWLAVSGTVALVDDRLVVVPERVSARREPRDPYLY